MKTKHYRFTKKDDKLIGNILKLKVEYDREKTAALQFCSEADGARSMRYRCLVKLYDMLELSFITRKEFDYITAKIYET